MDYMKRQAILSLIEATAACARQVSIADIQEAMKQPRGDYSKPDDHRFLEAFRQWRIAVMEEDVRL